MKSRAMIMAVIWSIFTSVTHAEAPPLKVSGIIDMAGDQQVLVEAPESGSARPEPDYMTLGPGQRDSKLEVVAIDAASGVVSFRYEGRALAITNSALRLATEGIALDNAPLELVLPLLGRLEERSILRHTSVWDITLSLNTLTCTRSEAAKAIKSGLATKQIKTVVDGAKFLIVIAESKADEAKPRSSEIKPSPGHGKGSEQIPAGMIYFRNALMVQVLMTFAGLKGCQFDKSAPLSPHAYASEINFKSQTIITRDECVYALETLIAWAGFKVVESEPGLLKAVTAQ